MRKSFQHAFDGLRIAFREHPNFRIHLTIAILVLGLSAILKISRIEFLIIIFTISLVLIIELLNTAIESITDLITIKWAQQAKVAKDVSAGMVLVSSFAAIVVGIIIFYPYVMSLIT